MRALRDGRIEQGARDFAAADAEPKVQLAYPRHGVWSGNNQLGVELPFDPNAVTPQTILKLDEWGFPEVWTVSLGVKFDGELLVNQAFDAVGLIAFGSGGITQEFEVDFVTGTTFSLAMNAINVRCRLNDLQAFALVPAPHGIKLQVQVARGAPARSRATVTRFLSCPALSDSSTLPSKIPAFAKSLQIVPLQLSDVPLVYGANFSVKFFANQGTANPVATVTGTFLGPSVKIPIPALARYFIASNAGAIPLFAAGVFNLFDE